MSEKNGKFRLPGFSDEQMEDLARPAKSRHPKGSHGWLVDNGFIMSRRMNYEAVGRKLLMVDDLPDGANAAYGLELARWCLVIEEEF